MLNNGHNYISDTHICFLVVQKHTIFSLLSQVGGKSQLHTRFKETYDSVIKEVPQDLLFEVVDYTQERV